MSFFDEADEPQPRQETRRQRTAGPLRARSGRPPGGSGRPPGSQHQQDVQTRRLVAAGVIVVIVIVIALLVKSCDSSATTNALKDYNARVNLLIAGSTANARNVLVNDLASRKLTSIGQDLAGAENTAQKNLTRAESLHAPGQMSAAQSSLLTVMRLRQQGLLLIAKNAANAANKKYSKDAIYQISLGTSQLYTSDVIYKTIVTEDIAKALNANSIPIGAGSGEQQINAAQVIPDLGWLDQTWIADKIGAQLSTTQANVNNDQANLTHGDQLNYVTVGSSQLYNGGTYTLPASEAQTWVLNVTNGGQTAENAVGCSVKIQDVSDTGTATIPTIAMGETSSCTVHLLSPPPKGPYTVIATVSKVPGEKNLQNNSATFTVNFT